MPRRLVVGAVAVGLLVSACAPLVATFDLGADEARTFALAVSGGEPRRAYDLLCPALRFGIPFDAFRDAVDASPFLLAATDVTIERYQSGGGLAVVQSGWIDSTNGVAAARFYLSKIDDAWCLTGVEIGGTPALPVPGAAAAHGGGSAAAAADRSQLPPALCREAYHAFGLANPATRRYRMTTGEEDAASGTQRAELVDVGPETARFRIIRGGALAVLGSIEVSLEPDGIYLIGSSEGSLQGRSLILPATLAPGSRWRSGYVLTSPGGGELRYDGSDVVEGRETVRTPAGEFDALRVVSDATLDTGTTHGVVHTVAWYVADVGSVRSESETTIGDHAAKVVVELVDRGSGASR